VARDQLVTRKPSNQLESVYILGVNALQEASLMQFHHKTVCRSRLDLTADRKAKYVPFMEPKQPKGSSRKPATENASRFDLVVQIPLELR
jgi:hypothetical protein